MSKAIGIDLGTTNSRVAVMEGGEAVVIPSAGGGRATPSVVTFLKNGRYVVGQEAVRLAVTHPDCTVSSIKRGMGSGRRISVDGRRYAPEEISAMILRKLKSDAEAYLDSPVTEAVVTVPASFTNAQRQATKDACKIAGLEVRRLINEPTAAALAYGWDKESDEKIMVCSLGGGYFDVSVFETDCNVIEVLATAGSSRLGGDDFDECIVRYLMDMFRQETGIDLRNDRIAWRRLKAAAEKAKAELSGVTAVTIDVPCITTGSTGPEHLNTMLSYAEFNDLTAHLAEALKGYVRQAMDDAGLSGNDISKVLLVGGSSRIPALRDAVWNITGKDGIIYPDECAAVGAAVQAGILTGDVRDRLVLDVTSLSLGVETAGGVCTRLIERNTTIPAWKSQLFSTAADNQNSVEIHVLQGEQETAAGNESVGRFFLDGIAPARKGVPKIEVTFSIDADGMLDVSAKDLGAGKEQHITFTSSANMSAEDIRKAVREAERHAVEDGGTQTDAKPRDDPGPGGGVRRPDREENAKADTIRCFLEIYDNLERAVQQAGDEENVHKKGMEMIFRQMNAVLMGLGVTVEDPIGQPFDPYRHEAVTHEINTNFGENTVSQVFRKGFLLDGKVIRFASVQVAN